MESSKKKGKLHVPEDPESDPSLSDSSPSESDSSTDINYRRYKINKRDTKKRCWKHKKQDLSDSSLSGYDSSGDSDYICKRRKQEEL